MRREATEHATPRDEVIPKVHRVIIDVDAARVVRLQMAPDLVRSASWLGLAHEKTGELEAQWSRDGSRLAFISISRDHKQAHLRVADASTGVVRTVLEEQMPTYYERLIWEDKLEMVTPAMPPRSDNWYGWAKAAYELLGFVFATGQVGGRKLEIVQWRIGAPRDDDIDRVRPGDLKGMHRALGAYLSRRDQVQQAIQMIETENIADEYGVPFLIVYGISGNTHRFWSIADARQKIGYRPEDNSQLLFAEKIAAIVRAAKP